jgi:MFS family permease
MTGLLGATAFFGAAVGLLVAGAAADSIGRRVVFVHIFWLFAGPVARRLDHRIPDDRPNRAYLVGDDLDVGLQFRHARLERTASRNVPEQ